MEKGDREGQWHARFPRNDRLCCNYEPHVLLANMGNIDWPLAPYPNYRQVAIDIEFLAREGAAGYFSVAGMTASVAGNAQAASQRPQPQKA